VGAVALELERKTSKACFPSGAVALPVICHSGRSRSSYDSCDGCKGEFPVEICGFLEIRVTEDRKIVVANENKGYCVLGLPFYTFYFTNYTSMFV
jgi:hypothetical protein